MKKRLFILVIAVAMTSLLALAAGCGTQSSQEGSEKLTEEKYAQIEIGMNTSDVKAILGEPSRTEPGNMGGGHSMGDGNTMGSSMAIDYWYYQGGKGWVRLEVADGKVITKSEY